MSQTSDMLVIQSLAFFGKKLLFKKKIKNLDSIKTRQDKIKNSNILEKIQFDDSLELNESTDLSPLPDDRKINKTFQFSPNERKDSQFWYWHQLENSEYGYIGSKVYIKQVLSIAFSSNFQENGNFTKGFENPHTHFY